MGMAERKPATYVCEIVRLLGGPSEKWRTSDLARSYPQKETASGRVNEVPAKVMKR